jgi:hypothetical protein
MIKVIMDVRMSVLPDTALTLITLAWGLRFSPALCSTPFSIRGRCICKNARVEKVDSTLAGGVNAGLNAPKRASDAPI